MSCSVCAPCEFTPLRNLHSLFFYVTLTHFGWLHSIMLMVYAGLSYTQFSGMQLGHKTRAGVYLLTLKNVKAQ